MILGFGFAFLLIALNTVLGTGWASDLLFRDPTLSTSFPNSNQVKVYSEADKEIPDISEEYKDAAEQYYKTLLNDKTMDSFSLGK